MALDQSSTGTYLSSRGEETTGGEEKVTIVNANSVEISVEGTPSLDAISYESLESGETCNSDKFDEILEEERAMGREPLKVKQRLLHVLKAGPYPVEPEELEEAQPWRVVRIVPIPTNEEDQQTVKEAVTGAMDKYFQQACKDKLVLKLKICHTPDGSLQVEVSASAEKKKSKML